MAAPTGLVWDRDPHTGAKHDLLRNYLQAWLPILISRYPRISYAEGFAGPGIYKGGEPGSPIVALEVVASHRGLLTAHPGRTFDLVFVEEQSGRRDRLEQEIARAHDRLGVPPANVRVHPPVHGDYAQELPPFLTGLDAWGAPMFVVLDSWGGPDIALELVRSVAENPSGEVLVTFGPSFLTRHGERPQHAESGDRAFGDQDWRGVFDQPPDRKWAYLVAAYRASLHKAGFKHVLGFEMVDEHGSQLWLMFGTNSLLGVEKMKDAMWSVDRAYGVRYRDPRDPNQMMLDIEQDPDTAPLSRIVLDVLGDGARTLDQLRDYALLETVYRRAHVRPVVQRLLKEGRLTRLTAGQLAGSTTLQKASEVAAGPEQSSLFDL